MPSPDAGDLVPPGHPPLVGFSISVYQTSGEGERSRSNWSEWESKNRRGKPTIAGGVRVQRSCNFWESYEQDLRLARDVGSTCFRLTLEWSRIEPEPGVVDEESVAHYHRILDSIEGLGMLPILTLHHFVHPVWFEEAGGFESDASVATFARWATLAFRLFGHRVRHWATFNEPNVAAFCGLCHGSFPPGKVFRLRASGQFLLRTLRAHAAAYEAMKAEDALTVEGGTPRGGGGARGAEGAGEGVGGAGSTPPSSLSSRYPLKIGLIVSHGRFEAKEGLWFPLRQFVGAVASTLNRLWGNDAIRGYLLTGVFSRKPFRGVPRLSRARDPIPGCDFLGINYYSRYVVDGWLRPTGQPGDTPTEMPYSLHPRGALEAAEYWAHLPMPVLFTEIGVSDSGDEVRQEMLDTYFPQLELAVKHHAICGILYWSLVDNFEWAHGYTQQFGVYAWRPGDGAKRTPRPSVDLLRTWFSRLSKLEVTPRASGERSQRGRGAGGGRPPGPAAPGASPKPARSATGEGLGSQGADPTSGAPAVAAPADESGRPLLPPSLATGSSEAV